MCQFPIRKKKMGLYTKRLHDIQDWMTIDSGRSLSIRKLSYLSWLITPCCGWTDCQEWICFYKHPVSVLYLTDVLGMSFSCLDLLCFKKKAENISADHESFFSSFRRSAVFGLHARNTCFSMDIWSFLSRFNVRWDDSSHRSFYLVP